MQQLTRKIRRSANIGLFGSIAVILVVLIFHFSPWHITYQSQEVFSWMLISGTILAVLAVVMALFSIRNTPRRLRELSNMAKAQEQGMDITDLADEPMFLDTEADGIAMQLIVLKTENEVRLAVEAADYKVLE